MGIKYGVCSGHRGFRINFGRTTLVCGTNAFIYATNLTGASISKAVGFLSPTVINQLCTENFFAQNASFSRNTQDNPVWMGCCADHQQDQGKLINHCRGGMSVSQDHTLNVSGQGDAYEVDTTTLRNVLVQAAQAISYPLPAEGNYVPQSASTEANANDWESGNATWLYFVGLGVDMQLDGNLYKSVEPDITVNVSGQTGQVDGTTTTECYYTQGRADDCSPQDVTSAINTFVNLLKNLA